jgi:hypothetical protein
MRPNTSTNSMFAEFQTHFLKWKLMFVTGVGAEVLDWQRDRPRLEEIEGGDRETR